MKSEGIVKEIYQKLCKGYGIEFNEEKSVLSYDESTLFCPAGMQQFKKDFKDENIKNITKANIQSCIRLNDLDLAGDGTHLINFNMIGFFSFRGVSLEFAIGLFLDFVYLCGLELDYVTIHPEKICEWSQYYPEEVEIKEDIECKWSDGEIGGYCTEFYVDGIEIGNIVNPLGNCIDVGFGLERMQMLVDKSPAPSRLEELIKGCQAMIDSGVRPGNNNHGYVLKKILRMIDKECGEFENEYFYQERKKRQNSKDRYLKLIDKNKDKSAEWWWDTHGVDLGEV